MSINEWRNHYTSNRVIEEAFNVSRPRLGRRPTFEEAWDKGHDFTDYIKDRGEPGLVQPGDMLRRDRHGLIGFATRSHEEPPEGGPVIWAFWGHPPMNLWVRMDQVEVLRDGIWVRAVGQVFA